MTSAGVLDLWEAGLTLTPAARAVLLLEAAGHADVTEWPIGRRDQALVSSYCSSRGSLAANAECPECSAALDVELDPLRLIDAIASQPSVTVEHGAYRVTARPPTAGDLVGLSAHATAADLRAELLERCVVAAELQRRPIAAAVLPEHVVALVESALADADPLADVELAVTCADCGAEWAELFDPVRFAWDAVESAARTIATDVHTLARAYGWSEHEILQLSPFRRHLYLSAVQ